MSQIAEYLEGKTVFLTGGTGFLGQAIMEKILWAAPGVKRIYLLIRPKRQLGGAVCPAQERLEKEIFPAPVFDRIRSRHEDGWQDFLREKLQAVSGDMAREQLAMDPEVYARLCEEADILVNSAALVSFDAPLDDAFQQNVLSTQRLVDFARDCRKVVLVHVSTAYVSGATDGSIPETNYHAAAPGEEAEPFPEGKFTKVSRDIARIQEIIRRVREESYDPELDRQFKLALLKRFKRPRKGRNVRRRDKIESLRRKWVKNVLTQEGMKWSRLRGWNDTYTYTKALGEQTILSASRHIPTVIMRPSVIESSLAEPTPGWLDGLRMADPLIAAIGKGRLRALPLNPEVTIDLVPVDLVVNALLAAIPGTAQEGGLAIYQVATGSRNPITLGELYDLIYRYFIKNPLPDKAGNPIRIKRLKFPNPKQFRLQHRLKTMHLNTVERTLERLPVGFTEKLMRKLSAARAASEKLHYYGEIYEPYLNLDCRFEVENTVRLFHSLSEEERHSFNFDVTQLNWRHYVQNVHIPGVKKYILKMEDEAVREAAEQLASSQLRHLTINDLLAQSALQYADKPALQIKRNDRWERFTYQQLKKHADQIGGRFLRMGFRKGDRVVLYSENQPQWSIAYLGAVSIGLVVVPLDAQTSRREVWAVARFTQARALLTSEACFKSFSSGELQANETSPEPIALFNIDRFCAPFALEDYPRSTQMSEESNPELTSPDQVEMGPDDLASIIFTTSTAVDPKGVMHTHRNFLTNLYGVNYYLPIAETDNLLSVLPLYHALEFTCGLLLAIYGGATVTYMRSLKPRVILETMRESGTTCMLGVPTLYALIRDDIERRISRSSESTFKSNLLATSKQLSRSVERTFGKNIGRQLFARVHQEFGAKIRVFVSGGSALGEDLYDDFKTLGMPIYEGYGLTETAPVLTVNPLNQSRRGSCGRPLPGVELRIWRPDRNGIGEIIVKSPSLMVGYYQNPVATECAIRDAWFHTGDLGWIDEDGYLYVTGRIKDVIVTGAGKNVYPADLEAIYRGIPHVQEIAVLGIKNELTEDVHAVIVPDRKNLPPNLEASEIKKIIQPHIQTLARELPSYHRLQSLHIWDAPLPRREGGDIDREAVRHRLVARLSESRLAKPAAASGQVVKASQEEEILAELSRLSSLPADKISRESNLYTDLGFDSLMAIELLLFLEHRFQISIPDEKASSIQTVDHLMKGLRSLTRQAAGDSRQQPVLRSELSYGERSALNRCLLGLSFLGLRALFKTYFDLEPRNTETLPRDLPYILAANHSSHLDTGAVISALTTTRGLNEAQKLHVLGASDYFFDTPLKRWFFSTFLNVVPIEREETSLAGLRRVKRILSQGEPVLIYPEGTRSRTGELQQFKPGLGLLAWESNVPVIPVYIDGTYQALPAGKRLPSSRQVKVIFGAPITTDPYRAHSGIPLDELFRKIATDVHNAIRQLRP